MIGVPVSKSMYATGAALVASVLLAACGSSSKPANSSTAATAPAATSGGSTATVKTASSTAAGGTILVDANGMTLYHLSGESAGKFICTTQACLAVWHPLKTTAGAAPSGSVSLATVRRPDGSLQVSYQGGPLYTFAGDKAAGEAKGQGVKDVGTWTVVKVGGSSGSAPTPAPASTETSGSGGGGGGYAY